MEKYNIRLASGELAIREGNLLKKHKYSPEVMLFVHKAYPNYGGKSWVVSELKTGLILTVGTTSKDAIAKVETMNADKNSLLARIDDVVSQYGAAN